MNYSGRELINTVPPGVKIVGLIAYKGYALLATERGVYYMGAGDESFKPLPVEWSEPKPAPEVAP